MIDVSTKQDYLSHPLIKENTILRREYQESIFINCLDRNCMVIIPTGLGKTIVGLMLAVQRLTKYPNSKVIFLAPTKPLVNQHFKSFNELTLISEEDLESITGTISPEKRKKLWDSLKVAFMTPQVLQNDIISNLYSIKDVSLIIFDECHRAVGDYAYCFIAMKYRELAKNCQILGLTASPGSTEGKITEIKNNLYIDHIEVRTEKDDDVKRYIQNVDNEWIKIKLPQEFLDIKKIIVDMLRHSYKFLKKIGLLGTVDISKVSRKDLLSLDKVINRRISNTRDDNEKFQMFNAKKLNANAIRLSHMDELVETQGINALKEYILKNQEKIRQNTANKSLLELFFDAEFKKAIELVNILTEKGVVHPKVEKLKEILHNQIKENKKSRVLVFCHYRDSVNNIVNYFQDDALISAHKFVGQQKKSNSDEGLSQKQQIEILEEFRGGNYNTLVATSVAEEGLDIAECDLVVFYDVVPSAIRSIQRRGRTGRNREGKVLILMAEGTRDESYYWAEKAKEKRMRESLKKLKRTDGNLKIGQSNLLNFIKEEETKVQDIENVVVKKIEGAENYEIICDTRETASAVVRTLSLMGVKIKLEQLDIADYLISVRVGIERKSADDFNDSIKDGRLFKELIDLKQNFECPIMILEGNPFKSSNLNENSIYGAITSIVLNLGISIYNTSNTYESAMFLYQLAKKEQSDSKSLPKIRFEKKPIETSNLLEYIVAGLPGINTARAKSLLEKFETLQRLFNAEVKELVEVEKIGKKTAQEIFEISRYDYNSEEENGN